VACPRLARRAACLAIACALAFCASAGQGADGAQSDPLSPAAIESRLAAAERLAAAGTGGCLERLALVASQLDALAADPAFAIVLPRGPARLSALRYRVHLARADCVSDAAERAGELRAALSAARQSVVDYRDGLDYQSMVIMQFNVAVTLRTVGDSAASVAELESAIGMDREYGFDEDAQENRQLLTRWQGLPAPGGTAPSEEVSQRTAVLRLAWEASDADVTLETSFIRIGRKDVVRSSASRTVQRHVRRPASGGWLVSYGPGEIVQGERSSLVQEQLFNDLVVPEAHGLLELPPVLLSAQGEFQRHTGTFDFAGRLQLEARRLYTEQSGGQALSRDQIHDLAVMFSAQAVANQAEEDHDLQTAAWNGASLEQGVWYRTQAQLMLPGSPAADITHEVEFAYTHQVPCVDGGEARCVEIVVHAGPARAAIAQAEPFIRRTLRLQGFRYWSATYMRMVLDPDTLTPYVRDTRRYWYASCGADCDSESVMERILWRAAAPRAAAPASAGQAPSKDPAGVPAVAGAPGP
jgi:hypothetical protein